MAGFKPFDSNDNFTKFAIPNLHQSVDSNPFVASLHFNDRIASLLPDDTQTFDLLFQKFSKLFQLRISGNVSANRLLKFIDKFQPEKLCFERTSLPESFFRHLGENRPFIRYLEISAEPNNLSRDFDFIFGIKNLRSLEFADCQLSLNFVVGAVKQLKSLHYIHFRQNYTFEINLRSKKEIYLRSIESGCFTYVISEEVSVSQFVNTLKSQLKAHEGFACFKELNVLLRHLDIEKQNHLFMMKKEIYEQTNSICLSKKHWLN